jgi:hypothetical protein
MLTEILLNDEISLRLAADDVRRCRFIKFLDENRIVVEQTDPPVDNSSLMSLIFFTHRPEKDGSGRMGFQARIENITPDNRIFIRQLTKPFFCDLRLWPRVQFDLLPEMQAFCGDREIDVVNISGGGTHIVLHEDDPASPGPGSHVEIKFIFEKGATTADGRILRLWTDQKGLRHVEVKFLGEPEISDFIYRR